MAVEFKTPTQVREEWFTELKALKPEINTSQTDNDWFVRGAVYGGVISGLYGDQIKISDDAHPQSAREEAVEKWLNLLFDSGFQDPTNATGPVRFTGASGTVLSAGAEFLFSPNGNTYQTSEDFPVSVAGTGLAQVTSVSTGQDQNLLEGADLTISSPPPGIDGAADVFSGDIANGTNRESKEDAVKRILLRLRNPPSGGTVKDYEQFTLNADAAVNDVNIVPFINGLGTVGVFFTAGTTDIDEAIDNDQPLVFLPSASLVASVLLVVDGLNPLTDCVFVNSAAELEVDATVRVKYISGTGATILTIDGEEITQEALVIRELRRAIAKTPLGGRKLVSAATGSVLAAELEEQIDINLSASPITVGSRTQIIGDRQVDDLAATGVNLLVGRNEKPIPGTIKVVEL